MQAQVIPMVKTGSGKKLSRPKSRCALTTMLTCMQILLPHDVVLHKCDVQ